MEFLQIMADANTLIFAVASTMADISVIVGGWLWEFFKFVGLFIGALLMAMFLMICFYSLWLKIERLFHNAGKL